MRLCVPSGVMSAMVLDDWLREGGHGEGGVEGLEEAHDLVAAPLGKSEVGNCEKYIRPRGPAIFTQKIAKLLPARQRGCIERELGMYIPESCLDAAFDLGMRAHSRAHANTFDSWDKT